MDACINPITIISVLKATFNDKRKYKDSDGSLQSKALIIRNRSGCLSATQDGPALLAQAAKYSWIRLLKVSAWEETRLDLIRSPQISETAQPFLLEFD